MFGGVQQIDEEITFDSPFIYSIMDMAAGLPVFAGVLDDPADKS